MSYIEDQLISGEKIVYQGKTSLFANWFLILLGIVTLPFFIGIVFLLIVAVRYFTTELAFTNKRVIAKFGLIARRTIELKLEKIESVQVNQGIFGRILNYGTLVISGAGNPQAPITGISNPMTFKRSLQEHTDQTV